MTTWKCPICGETHYIPQNNCGCGYDKGAIKRAAEKLKTEKRVLTKLITHFQKQLDKYAMTHPNDFKRSISTFVHLQCLSFAVAEIKKYKGELK